MKHILVTGSSGTIGTRLCERLMVDGFTVTGVDWRENKWNKNVDAVTIHVDLRDKDTIIERLPKDVDAVIHLAANARVYNLVEDPSLARDNFETTFNVLEYARKYGIGRFMFASSREVYGNTGQIVHREDDTMTKHCESPYTASKIGGEALVHAYNQCYGMNYLIFRFSNVYGMYDESDRVVPLFISKCSKDEDIVVYGKEKLLDFTYIDDTVDGIMLSIENFSTIKNDVFNLACGVGTSIVDVAHLIRDTLNSKSAIEISDNRTGEVVKYVADKTKAEKAFGFDPKVSAEEGILKSIAWYKTNVL